MPTAGRSKKLPPRRARLLSSKGVGAGGEVRLAPVVAGLVSIGPLAASNAPAMVADGGLPLR